MKRVITEEDVLLELIKKRVEFELKETKKWLDNLRYNRGRDKNDNR